MNLGNNIVKLRKEKNLSHEDLGNEVGTSGAIIGRLTSIWNKFSLFMKSDPTGLGKIKSLDLGIILNGGSGNNPISNIAKKLPAILINIDIAVWEFINFSTPGHSYVPFNKKFSKNKKFEDIKTQGKREETNPLEYYKEDKPNEDKPCLENPTDNDVTNNSSNSTKREMYPIDTIHIPPDGGYGVEYHREIPMNKNNKKFKDNTLPRKEENISWDWGE